MDGSKPWYQSKAIWGSIISIASSALVLFGVNISPDLIDPLTDNLVLIGTVAGSLVALYGRLKAETKIGKPEKPNKA